MRQMKNLRTGRVAVYDEALVESGGWEEVIEKPKATETKQPKKKAIISATAKGELEVKPTGGTDEGVQRQT